MWIFCKGISTVFLTNNKFGLSIYPPSVKFIQCQTVLRKALKFSPNESTNDLWKATSNHTNIQYDAYNSTKEVLKDFRSGHEDKLLNQLTSQGSFFCSVTKFAYLSLTRRGPSPNRSSRKTFTTLPFVTLTTLFRPAKT